MKWQDNHMLVLEPIRAQRGKADMELFVSAGLLYTVSPHEINLDGDFRV